MEFLHEKLFGILNSLVKCHIFLALITLVLNVVLSDAFHASTTRCHQCAKTNQILSLRSSTESATFSNLVGDSSHQEVYQVPQTIQKESSQAIHEFGQYYSLEGVFPGSNLADVFDTDAAFRRSIRVATRDDLFIPNPKWSSKVNDMIKDLGSTLLVDWRSSPTGYSHLSALFKEYGVGLTGEDFILGIGALCQTPVVGSLTDIVRAGNRKNVAHSWHQDAGTPTFTTMLGFPDRNNYEGVGVFSHAVKLSHPLKQLNDEGSVIEWENYPDYPGPIPEENIIRPVYKKGQEILVYKDCDHLHSAPDEFIREALWRFM